MVCHNHSVLLNMHESLKLLSRRRSAVVVEARRQKGWDSRSKGNNSSSRDDRAFRFKFNNVDVALAEDQMWQLAVPFAVLFGLAIFIGEQ